MTFDEIKVAYVLQNGSVSKAYVTEQSYGLYEGTNKHTDIHLTLMLKDGIFHEMPFETLVLMERERQVKEEGHTLAKDEGVASSLFQAAAAYQKAATVVHQTGKLMGFATHPPDPWPWLASSWNPSTFATRNRVKAGALALAGLDALTAQEAKDHEFNPF